MPDHGLPQHDVFTLERRYAASPARVYRALTDPAAKAVWFAGPNGWEQHERRMDARVGGTERVVGRHATGFVSAFDAHYLDLVPDERIIFAYTMHLDARLISASLATWTLHPDGTGTRLVLTEQGTFLGGYADDGGREEGTNLLLDALGAALDGPMPLEVLATRTYPHPPEAVFEAVRETGLRERWWGPDGFTSTTATEDFRAGGEWHMTMHGPDGAAYPNVYRYVTIEAPHRVVLHHPGDPHWFELTIELAEAPGGTALTWRQRFSHADHFAEIKDFVTAANDQVLARLGSVLG